MKGMIFAAGIGSRLKPLTNHLPKALININGKPMLEHVILRMKECGVSKIIINTHHLAYQIADFIERNENFGLNIIISEEKELLDTGGGIINARKFLEGDEAILMYNSDIFSNFPLNEMTDYHIENGNDVTLLTQQRNTSRYLLFDSDCRMHGWMKNNGMEIKPVGLDYTKYKPLAFGGVHIMNPEILDRLDRYAFAKGRIFSITSFYIDCCREIKIKAYQPVNEYEWYDIGKPEILEKLADY